MTNSQNIWLSKSTLMQSFQCPKALFLQKNYYELRDTLSPETLALFKKGRNIEQEAREQLFPEGINLQPKSPRQWKAVAELTNQLIKNGEPIIYEATFVSQGVMCAVDVVKVINPNELEFFEIKSGTSVKEVYILDMSIQYEILSQLGYRIRSAQLVHPQNYEQNAIEFNQVDLTDECKKRQVLVGEQIETSKRILSQSRIPDIARGEQCHEPYKCAFLGFCGQQEQLFED